MIAEVVAATGWTWSEALDDLTTPRYLALRGEWRLRPPTHWLAAAALGYRAPDATIPVTRPSIAELQAAFR